MARMKGTAGREKELKLSEIFEIHEARNVCGMGCRGCMCEKYCKRKLVEERNKLLYKVSKIEKVLEESGYDFPH